MSDLNEGRLMPLLGTVLGEVRAERVRQHTRWGEQDWPDGTGRSLFGGGTAYVAGMTLEATARTQQARDMTYAAIFAEEAGEVLQESDPDKLMVEIIQCAAVLVAWAEKIRRERAKGAL